MAHFYAKDELKEWIILFSKLAFLPVADVQSGYAALIDEYEGMVLNQIASADDQQYVAGNILS
jgi:hypothetical protein